MSRPPVPMRPAGVMADREAHAGSHFAFRPLFQIVTRKSAIHEVVTPRPRPRTLRQRPAFATSAMVSIFDSVLHARARAESVIRRVVFGPQDTHGILVHEILNHGSYSDKLLRYLTFRRTREFVSVPCPTPRPKPRLPPASDPLRSSSRRDRLWAVEKNGERFVKKEGGLTLRRLSGER